MSAPLTQGAALLLGIAASGHCVLMCGGISTALGVATARGPNGRPRVGLLVGYQLGRVLSYTLAGLIAGAGLGALVGVLDIEAVRRTLRALAALALVLGALVVLGWVRDPGARIGRTLWPRLAPLGRRLLPVSNLPRALAFGMIWGWMPCGIVYTVLLIASLQLHPVDAATTMAAFGLGTTPAMLATAFGAAHFAGFAARPATRRIAGAALMACALLTAAAPWLVAGVPALHHWIPFDCAPGQ